MSPKWLSELSQPVQPNAQLQLTAEKTQYLLGETTLKAESKLFRRKNSTLTKRLFAYPATKTSEETRFAQTNSGYSKVSTGKTRSHTAPPSNCLNSCISPKASAPTTNMTWKFHLQQRATLYSIDHYAKWLLAAVLQVKDRPNILTQNYEIQVEKPAVDQAAPVIMKEVEREIVLVPCSYCGSLMPQTALFCPNCGARKKS